MKEFDTGHELHFVKCTCWSIYGTDCKSMHGTSNIKYYYLVLCQTNYDHIPLHPHMYLRPHSEAYGIAFLRVCQNIKTSMKK